MVEKTVDKAVEGTAAGVGLIKDNERRKMKKNTYMYLCACLLFCGTAVSAETLGSADEDIQKNFNQLVATKQCPGCNLRGAVLTRMDLREADLQGADLSNAKLSLANLSKAKLKNAVLRGAVLGGADFSGADLRGVDLTDAQLAGAYLKEALLDQEITPEKPYQPEELLEALPEEVEEVELPEASTQIAPLPPAQEIITPEPELDAVISAAEEEKALPSTLPSAEIPTDTSLSSSGIEESSVVLVPELPAIEGRTATTVRSKELVPIAEAQIVDSSSQADNLPDALPDTLSDTKTAEAESNAAELGDIPVIDTVSEQAKGGSKDKEPESSLWESFTSLFGSDAAPAEQEKIEKKGPAQKASEVKKDVAPVAQQQVGAYRVETFGQSRARLQTLVDKLGEEKRCVSCDLAGANLSGKDLEEVDLERANLSGAQLEKADLRAANLKGVNFTDANLKNADLRKADLYLADFTNADLTGAQLQGALIDSTTFTSAIGAKIETALE
ncbi:MAG: pentapeptide repeat-containing protein [Candidatus Electrothrix sp.]